MKQILESSNEMQKQQKVLLKSKLSLIKINRNKST